MKIPLLFFSGFVLIVFLAALSAVIRKFYELLCFALRAANRFFEEK